MSWAEIKKAINQNLDTPLSDLYNMEDLALFGSSSSVYNDKKVMEQLFYSQNTPNHMVVNQYVFDFGVENELHLGDFFKRMDETDKSIDWDSLDTLEKLCASEEAMQDISAKRVALDLVNSSESLQNNIVGNKNRMIVERFTINKRFVENTFSSPKRLEILAKNPVALGGFIRTKESQEILLSNETVHDLVWTSQTDLDIIFKTAVEVWGGSSAKYETYLDIIADEEVMTNVLDCDNMNVVYSQAKFREAITENSDVNKYICGSDRIISKFVASYLGHNTDIYDGCSKIMPESILFSNENVIKVICNSDIFMRKAVYSDIALSNMNSKYTTCGEYIANSDVAMNRIANTKWTMDRISSGSYLNIFDVLVRNENAMKCFEESEIAMTSILSHDNLTAVRTSAFLGTSKYTTIQALIQAKAGTNLGNNASAMNFIVQSGEVFIKGLINQYNAYNSNSDTLKHARTYLGNLFAQETARQIIEECEEFYDAFLNYSKVYEAAIYNIVSYYFSAKYGATNIMTTINSLITAQYDGTNYGYDKLLKDESFLNDLMNSSVALVGVFQNDYTSTYQIMNVSESFTALENNEKAVELSLDNSAYGARFYLSKKFSVGFSTSSSYLSLANWFANYYSNILNSQARAKIALNCSPLLNVILTNSTYTDNAFNTQKAHTMPVVMADEELCKKVLLSNQSYARELIFNTQYATLISYVHGSAIAKKVIEQNDYCLGAYLSWLYNGASTSTKASYFSVTDFLTNVDATVMATKSNVMSYIKDSVKGTIGFIHKICGIGVGYATTLLDNATNTESYVNNLTAFNALDNSDVTLTELTKHNVGLTKYIAKALGVTTSDYTDLGALFSDHIDDILDSSETYPLVVPCSSVVREKILGAGEKVVTKYLAKLIDLNTEDYEEFANFNVDTDLEEIFGNETTLGILTDYIKANLDSISDDLIMRVMLANLEVSRNGYVDLNTCLNALDISLILNAEEDNFVFTLLQSREDIFAKCIARAIDLDVEEYDDYITVIEQNLDLVVANDNAIDIIALKTEEVCTILDEKDYDTYSYLILRILCSYHKVSYLLFTRYRDALWYSPIAFKVYGASTIQEVSCMDVETISTNIEALHIIALNYSAPEVIDIMKKLSANQTYCKNVFNTVANNPTKFKANGNYAQDGVSNLNQYCTVSKAYNSLIFCCLGYYGSNSTATTTVYINGTTIATKRQYSNPQSVTSSNVNAIVVPTATFTENGDAYAAISVYQALV